ncbi:MAG: enoyl-CoA hydratase/isomerase family protein [Mycobacterium sp.]
MPSNTGEVLSRVDGTVGVVTLNRPRAINALTHSMITTLHPVLTQWAENPAITAVVVNGAGTRGLCAGGDVVAIYHSARNGGADARRFWYDEYRLNALISKYPKPYVALMDGVVMGGGVGISAHGNTRIVTDRSMVGMPEVKIGLIPDVGGTYLLARAPGLLGLHAGLTGAPFTGADAIAMGFADHFVPHDRLTDLTRAIITDGVPAALATYATEPPSSNLAAQQKWIDHCYAGDTVADILAELRGHHCGPANAAADVIACQSPIAVSVTLQAIRQAANLDNLEDVLEQEYRTVCASLKSHDLVEGIRAQLVDKDRNPRWSPASIADITAQDVAAYFEAEVDA